MLTDRYGKGGTDENGDKKRNKTRYCQRDTEMKEQMNVGLRSIKR